MRPASVHLSLQLFVCCSSQVTWLRWRERTQADRHRIGHQAICCYSDRHTRTHTIQIWGQDVLALPLFDTCFDVVSLRPHISQNQTEQTFCSFGISCLLRRCKYVNWVGCTCCSSLFISVKLIMRTTAKPKVWVKHKTMKVLVIHKHDLRLDVTSLSNVIFFNQHVLLKVHYVTFNY